MYQICCAFKDGSDFHGFLKNECGENLFFGVICKESNVSLFRSHCNPLKTTRVFEKGWRYSRILRSWLVFFLTKIFAQFLSAIHPCWTSSCLLVSSVVSGNWRTEIEVNKHILMRYKSITYFVFSWPSTSKCKHRLMLTAATQNSGQINEKSRDFSANARKTS